LTEAFFDERFFLPSTSLGNFASKSVHSRRHRVDPDRNQTEDGSVASLQACHLAKQILAKHLTRGAIHDLAIDPATCIPKYLQELAQRST